jgi:hypothetical protein
LCRRHSSLSGDTHLCAAQVSDRHGRLDPAFRDVKGVSRYFAPAHAVPACGPHKGVGRPALWPHQNVSCVRSPIQSQRKTILVSGSRTRGTAAHGYCHTHTDCRASVPHDPARPLIQAQALTALPFWAHIRQIAVLILGRRRPCRPHALEQVCAQSQHQARCYVGQASVTTLVPALRASQTRLCRRGGLAWNPAGCQALHSQHWPGWQQRSCRQHGRSQSSAPRAARNLLGHMVLQSRCSTYKLRC